MKERITSTILTPTVSEPLSREFSMSKKTERKKEFSVIMSNQAESFCVGIVDIVNSTRTVAKLTQNKASMYYEIYLNHMANIIEKCNGMVLKTMGDSLLFYFPDSRHSNRKYGFLSSIECAFLMIDKQEELNQKLQDEGLPKIDFRISADYGNVTIMKKTDNTSIDLVGPTINTCSKINDKAPENGIVIGGDLYVKTKNFSEFSFKKIESFSTGLKHSYPIYCVYRKN
jgi:class 3 adenylate cyclase